MKLETVDVSESERRVLRLFDPGDPRPEDGAARAYIEEQDMEPKRRYRETRGTTEYEVYYFGLCYLEDHLDHLVGLASEANLQFAIPRSGGSLPPAEEPSSRLIDL